jgi:hypothetical protein
MGCFGVKECDVNDCLAVRAGQGKDFSVEQDVDAFCIRLLSIDVGPTSALKNFRRN